jgi:hypothetical protein
MTHGQESSAFNGWMSFSASIWLRALFGRRGGADRARVWYLEHLENDFNAAPCAVQFGPIACRSKPNPLNLVLCEPLFPAVIKLGRARALVRGHLAVARYTRRRKQASNAWYPVANG